MEPVNSSFRPSAVPIGERLGVLLTLFSPWERISLTYRQFAAELGPPVTEAAIKKWPHRKKFPADTARLIVAKAQERGLLGVTLEWVLWGDGRRPEKGPKKILNRDQTGHQDAAGRPPEPRRPPGATEPHGVSAARIAQALEADLSHNEFGQWSSLEVQHTVIWALKDLARRLWVLHFDMGQTFELTDEWAGAIGLPVRPTERTDDEAPG